MAALLALSGALLWGAGDFLGGLASRRLAVLTVLAVSQAIGLAGVILWVALAGDPFPGATELLPAAAAGVAGLIGLGALYRGLAVGAMGIVAPISAAGPVVPLAVDVAQGVVPDALQWIGVALVITGNRDHLARAVSRWWSSDRRRSQLGDRGGDRLRRLFRRARRGSGRKRPVGGRLGAVGVGDGRAGGGCPHGDIPGPAAPASPHGRGSRSLRHRRQRLCRVRDHEGRTGIVAVLSALYPVITVVLARLVLREELGMARRAGGVLALAGAALVAVA